MQRATQFPPPGRHVLQQVQPEGRAPHRDEAQVLVGTQVSHGGKQRVVQCLGQGHLLRHRLRQVGQRTFAPGQHLHVVVDVASCLRPQRRRDPRQRPVMRARRLTRVLRVQIPHPGRDHLVQLVQEQLGVRDPLHGRGRAAGGLIARHGRIDQPRLLTLALFRQRLGVVRIGGHRDASDELFPRPVGAHAMLLPGGRPRRGGEPAAEPGALHRLQFTQVPLKALATWIDQQFEKVVSEGCTGPHLRRPHPASGCPRHHPASWPGRLLAPWPGSVPRRLRGCGPARGPARCPGGGACPAPAS